MTDQELTTLERRLDIEVPIDVIKGAVQYLSGLLTPAWESVGEALVDIAAAWPEDEGQHKQIIFKTSYGHHVVADRFPHDLCWIVRAESAALTQRLMVAYNMETSRWEWTKL